MNHEERLELSKLREWKLLGGWGKEHPDEYDVTPLGDVSLKPTPLYPTRAESVLLKNKPKLEAILNRSPYNFNLFFLRSGQSKRKKWHNLAAKDMEEGRLLDVRALNFLMEEGVYPETLNWKRSINFLFLGTGVKGTNMPPTPWIVLHWMAHALIAGADGRKHGVNDDSHTINRLGIWELLADLLENSYTDVGESSFAWSIEDLRDMKWKLKNETIHLLMKSFMPALFSFRSARSGRLTSHTEGIHDLFTQYMWNPRKRGIVLNNLPRRLETLDGILHKKKTADKATRWFKLKVEDIFEEILVNAVGKWYFTGL